MNFLKNKRAEAFTIILVVIIIVIFLGWLVDFKSKECRSNSDCPADFYCGSDFSCHQIPTIEKTIIKNNLIIPSIIIGIAIIISAIVLNSRKPYLKSSNPEKEEKTYKNPLKIP